jgi:hypothetical protein
MAYPILPFTSALSGASRPSHFVAVHTDAPDGGDFMSITPRVMRWNASTYILDLTTVTQYWTQIATEQGMSFTDFLPKLFAQLPHPPERITMADHPWRALVTLSVILTRPTLNFLDVQSHLGRKILHEVSWINWFELCRELRDHLIAAGSKNIQVSFSAMTKTVERMHITHVAQMADVEAPAMQRRFGKLIATAWEWTWSKPKSATDNNFSDGFPWQGITTKVTPSISRHLESSLREWEHIAPILCEDLNKLCNLNCWTSSERVVSLEWVLSFSCSPSLHIPVLFRHPHALHRESGHHKTALLQAFYSWQNAMRSRQKPESSGETYFSDDAVTEWTLVVTERLLIPSTVKSLFKDDLSTEHAQLRDLENSLPVSLVSYDTTDHWSPERSFAKSNTGESNDPVNIACGNIARLAMYQRRPLFMYENPEPLTSKHQSSGMVFCERLTTSWWTDTSPSPRGTCRNYYVRMTDDGLLQWVFQNDDGSLCLHGLYG